MKVMRKAIDAGKNEGFYDSSHDEESDYNDYIETNDEYNVETNEVSTDEYKIIRVDFELLMLKLIYKGDVEPIDYISRFKGDDEIDLSQPCFLINSEGDIKPLHPEYSDSVTIKSTSKMTIKSTSKMTVHKKETDVDDIVYDFVYDFMYGKINISISFKSLMSILNFNK